MHGLYEIKHAAARRGHGLDASPTCGGGPRLAHAGPSGVENFPELLRQILSARTFGCTLEQNKLSDSPDDGHAEEKQSLKGFVSAVIHARRLDGLVILSMATRDPS